MTLTAKKNREAELQDVTASHRIHLVKAEGEPKGTECFQEAWSCVHVMHLSLRQWRSKWGFAWLNGVLIGFLNWAITWFDEIFKEYLHIDIDHQDRISGRKPTLKGGDNYVATCCDRICRFLPITPFPSARWVNIAARVWRVIFISEWYCLLNDLHLAFGTLRTWGVNDVNLGKRQFPALLWRWLAQIWVLWVASAIIMQLF